MSTAGWRHPALIFTLFLLAAFCLIFGAGWPAFKEISPPALSAPIHQVATSPVAWFAILILGMTAAVLFPKRRVRASVATAPLASSAQETVVPAAPIPTQPSRKIFIDASPAFLIGLYENRTSLQADALAAAYKGKWISINGTVADIAEVSVDHLIAVVHVEGKIVVVNFLKEEEEKILHLAHGAPIGLQGKIYEINDYMIKLSDCNLV